MRFGSDGVGALERLDDVLARPPEAALARDAIDAARAAGTLLVAGPFDWVVGTVGWHAM